MARIIEIDCVGAYPEMVQGAVQATVSEQGVGCAALVAGICDKTKLIQISSYDGSLDADTASKSLGSIDARRCIHLVHSL